MGGGDIFPLEHTKIELKKLGDPDILLKTATTDGQGFFEISDVEKGKYRLGIYFIFNGREVAPKFDVILDVKKSNTAKSNKYIFVSLALDCGESIVKLGKKD